MKKLIPGTDIRELMLDVARGRTRRLDPASKPLSLFVLLNKGDVQLGTNDPLGLAGILFLTEATAAQMTDSIGSGGAASAKGYVLSIAGVVSSQKMEVERSDLIDLTIDQGFVLRQLNPLSSGAWGASLLKFFQAADGDYMSELAEVINERRWTSSVWVERDRAQLRLTDELTGKEVFNLWDDDFHQAVEDGFLVVPRLPRPSDSEWHQPALGYAESSGLLSDLELRPKGASHSMPIAAPASRSIDRPRG